MKYGIKLKNEKVSAPVAMPIWGGARAGFSLAFDLPLCLAVSEYYEA